MGSLFAVASQGQVCSWRGGDQLRGAEHPARGVGLTESLTGACLSSVSLQGGLFWPQRWQRIAEVLISPLGTSPDPQPAYKWQSSLPGKEEPPGRPGWLWKAAPTAIIRSGSIFPVSAPWHLPVPLSLPLLPQRCCVPVPVSMHFQSGQRRFLRNDLLTIIWL